MIKKSLLVALALALTALVGTVEWPLLGSRNNKAVGESPLPSLSRIAVQAEPLALVR